MAPPSPLQAAGVAQPADDAGPFEGRVIGAIQFAGLERVTELYLRNNVRSIEGAPLSWATVRDDLRKLERLGEFREIRADVEPRPDGSVTVIYTVTEAPIVRAVDVVGNTQINDEQIAVVVADVVSLIAGVPIDDFRIGQAKRAIEQLYRTKGFYFVEVTVDETELNDTGAVIFRVREGERTKVTSIRFSGNASIGAGELRPQLKIKRAGIFQAGALDDTLLDDSVAALTKYYRDRGFLDARVSRTIQPSPNGREAIVTFIVDEGRLYTLRSIIIRSAAQAAAQTRPADEDAPADQGLTVYTPEQLLGVSTIKAGDTFVARDVEGAVDAIRDAYQQLGYIDAVVRREELRDTDTPQVDLRLTIIEGERWRTGVVETKGNDITQTKVILRETQLRPGRWLDGTELKRTEAELNNSRLFGRDPVTGQGTRITIQPEKPAEPDHRDVLIEVEETNTGSFSFGAGVNSDLGVFGVINFSQRNFDIADTPDSFEEFFRGRAFRGAGQTFNIALQPGFEASSYSVSLTEPSLFESDYSLGSTAFFTQREYDEYDDDRLGSRFRLGRRFGTRWIGGVSIRAEAIDITDIDDKSPVDVFEVEGDSILTSVGFDLARTTVDNRFRPTKGTRTELGIEQVGVLGGDYDYTKLQAAYSFFLTVDENELGYKTVLSLNSRVGWIPQEDESPVFERFYLGGRSFRGFDFRGIGPTGIRNDNGQRGDEHVGGDFSFFLGLELEKPVWRDLVSVVGFVDTGTVNEDFGFEDYRVSVGVGVRLYLPQFGAAPLAFDFGFPILEQSSDDTRLFSFAFDIPF